MGEAWLEEMLHRWRPACRRRPSWAVACSGGPDSQALLHVLARAAAALGIARLEAVGVDHGLRPAAAAELQLAATLAGRLGVGFTVLPVRLAPRGNRLDAARRARRAALADFAHRRGLQAVALGHHADDQLETVLHHLASGCGLRGAAGMLPLAGLWARPLLHVGRAALLAHLEAHRIAWATDPSNGDRRRLRARLRAEVVPPLARALPAAAQQVGRFAARARDDDRLLWRLARRRLARLVAAAPWADDALAALPQAALAGLPRPLFVRLLALWLGPGPGGGDVRPLDAAFVDGMWRGRRRPALAVARPPWRLRMERGWLFRQPVAPRLPPAAGAPLRVPGKTAMAGVRGAVAAHWVDGGVAAEIGVLGGFDLRAVFDAEALGSGLTWRAWRPGDRLRSWGLEGRGSCKVGDLFTNLKVPTALRDGWPVVVAGEALLWVPGIGRSCLAPVGRRCRRQLRLEFAGPPLWVRC